jgi:hypothetical protein
LDGEVVVADSRDIPDFGSCTPLSPRAVRTGCSTTDDLDIPAPRE